MTASFSLRLRLKVYSFICAIRFCPLMHALGCSDQLFRNEFHLQRDRHLRWPSNGLTSCSSAHQRSWMAWVLCSLPAHHIGPTAKDRRFLAITLRWTVCPRGRQRPWWRTATLRRYTPFARSRFGLVQRVDQRSQVTLELFVVERTATNGAVHDTGLVDTELHLTSLGVLHSRGNVRRHCANLGVRHQDRVGPEFDPAYPPRASRRGAAITTSKGMSPALTMAARSSIPTTSAPAALASSALAPWANTATRVVLPGAVGQHHGATHHLVGLLGVDASCTATSMDSSNLAVAASFTKATASANRYRLGWNPPCPASFFCFWSVWPFTHPPPSRPSNGQNQPWCERLRPRRRRHVLHLGLGDSSS